MTSFRKVTEYLSVAPQLTPEHMRAAAAQGFGSIICNRPDGEEAGMPSSDEMREIAEAAGLEFVYLPFAGPPPAELVRQQQQHIESADKPVLAYCRSGTRSVTAWVLGKTVADDRNAAVEAAANAGYDLSSLHISV